MRGSAAVILSTLSLTLITSTCSSAVAQEPEPTETLREFRQRVRSLADELRPAKEEATKTETMRAAKAAIAAQPTTPGADDGFAERVSGTITDFLPLLHFAVQEVTTGDDKESVTVTFNPIRTGVHGAIQVQATAVQPEPFESLLEAIDESARAAQRDLIEEELGDFDDVLWSARYGYQKSATGKDWGEVKRMWGRDVELYRPFVDEIVAGGLDASLESFDPSVAQARIADYEATLAMAAGAWVRTMCPLPAKLKELVDRCELADFCSNPDASIDPGCLTFAEINKVIVNDPQVDFSLDDLADAVMAEIDAIDRVDDELASYSLDTLAELIHNQPQLVVSVSYRNRNELAGPDLFAGSVRYEMGGRNFNSVLRAYRDLAPREHGDGPAQTPINAYSQVLDEDASMWRYTFSASYKRRHDYRLDFDYEQAVADPDGGDDTTLAKMASVHLDESEEWSAKVQISRFLTERRLALAGGDEAMPRFDVSGEYFYTSDDPNRQDRLVVTLSYDMAVNDTISVPLSLVYANHSEFLGDPDERLSAHFGLSYKLNKGDKGSP